MGRKWRVRCLLAAVLGCWLSVWVWAAGFTVYEIKPLQLEISLPEDYWVSFYDPSDPDTWPEVSGLSQEQLGAYLKDMGVYLSAASPDRMTEVWVEMEEGSTADYTQVREEDFYLLLWQMEALYEDEEVEYLGAELYRHPQTPFLQVDTRQTVGNLDLYTRLYHTVYGGNSLDFYFRFLTDSLTAWQEDFTQEVMDSVSFCGEAGQTLAEENSFQDEKTGAVLFVPEGWEAQDIQTESAYLTVRFLPEEAGTAGMILYSSFDLPGSEALEKDGRDRTEVGHSRFTPQEVAQLLGQEEGEIAQVTCGEMEYCQIQSEFTATLEGIAMTAPVTTLARTDDGYLYVYQFYGDREGAYFDDFLQMAANAVYPGAGQASESGIEALEPPDTSSGGQESNGRVCAGGQDQEAGGGQKTGTQASAASGEEAAPHWPDDSESGKIQPEGEEPASSRAASEQDSPGSGQEKTGTESKPGRGILGFVVTVLTVMVPLALYRYGMRRRPLSRPEAGKVAAAYTLGVWAGMMWLGFPDHRLAVTVAGIVAVGPAFVLLAEKKGAASREHNQPDGTAPAATAPEAGTEVEAPMADGGTERPAKSEGWHTENEEREGPARAAGDKTEATPEPAGEAQATEGAVGPAQAAGEKTEAAPEQAREAQASEGTIGPAQGQKSAGEEEPPAPKKKAEGPEAPAPKPAEPAGGRPSLAAFLVAAEMEEIWGAVGEEPSSEIADGRSESREVVGEESSPEVADGPARAAGEKTEATPEPAGEAQAPEGTHSPAQGREAIKEAGPAAPKKKAEEPEDSTPKRTAAESAGRGRVVSTEEAQKWEKFRRDREAAERRQNERYCLRCGSRLEPGRNRCRKCGASAPSTGESDAQPDTFLDCYLDAFRQYGRTQGKTNRRAFWMFYLIHFLVGNGLGLLAWKLESPDLFWICVAYGLAAFCPTVAIQIRRLHDVGRSGWWIGASIVPLLSLYLLYLYCKPSQTEERPKSPGKGEPAARKQCPRCGHREPEENRYCTQCGARLP